MAASQPLAVRQGSFLAAQQSLVVAPAPARDKSARRGSPNPRDLPQLHGSVLGETGAEQHGCRARVCARCYSPCLFFFCSSSSPGTPGMPRKVLWEFPYQTSSS